MYKICHTEESSRRQRELERGLLDFLRHQPYKAITLTELCRQLKGQPVSGSVTVAPGSCMFVVL